MADRKNLKTVLEQIAEKADTYLVTSKMPLPPHIHVEGLIGGMEEIRALALKALGQPTRTGEAG